MADRTIRRILITGAAGSAGRHLAEYVRANRPGVEIYGLVRRHRSRRPQEGVTFLEADLLDGGSAVGALMKTRPDAVFHLAANPDKGFEIPSAILANNAVGTASLLEAVRLAWPEAVFVNCSSSEVYGDIRPWEVPIKEDCPTRPVSPYGVSKLAQDHLGRVYHRAYGMPVVTTRAFSYVSRYRTDIFLSDFARQVAEVEGGKLKVLKHGSLTSVRVLLAAEQIAEAYWLAATRCAAGGVYNVGGTDPVSVGEVLDRLRRLASVFVPAEEDPALLRPADVAVQVPDCTKFRSETGWSPAFDLDASLRKLLDFWREGVARC